MGLAFSREQSVSTEQGRWIFTPALGTPYGSWCLDAGQKRNSLKPKPAMARASPSEGEFTQRWMPAIGTPYGCWCSDIGRNNNNNCNDNNNNNNNTCLLKKTGQETASFGHRLKRGFSNRKAYTRTHGMKAPFSEPSAKV